MAMLASAADCQRSPWHNFGVSQLVLSHATPVRGSGGGMEQVPVGNLNAAVQGRVPSAFIYW